MLGMLVQQNYIQKELNQQIKSLLMILIMMELNLLCEKKILARLKRKTVFASLCIVIKIGWFLQSTFQVKNLKTQ